MLKNSYTKYFLLFVISVLIYFSHAAFTWQGIYGDGNGYYSYANTLYFQGNLDFNPVYDYLTDFKGPRYIFSRIFWDKKSNPYLIGTSLIWIPSFAFISTLSRLFNLNIDRFDLLYELGPGLTGIVLMITGLAFLEKYLLNFFDKRTVSWTILTVFFASGVFYYTAFEPGLSHQPSFFIICFLLWRTYKFKKTGRNLFILGLFAGFLASVRIADTILLIPIFLQAKLKPKDFLILTLPALIAFIPQLINQHYMYGTVLTHPYINGDSGTWQFSLNNLLEYLTSARRGLFLWTPLFLISVYGLIKDKKWTVLLTILILWIVTSSWSAYLSAGFGQRFSFSAIPYFAYGLAYVFNKMPVKKIGLIFVVFSLWNSLLLKNIYLHKDLFIQDNNFTLKEFLTYMLQLH